MRHFFITTLERLMNVLVVLTALGILALSGRMAIEAQGDTQALLRAAVVFLGGIVALLTVAGVAYLAIDIRQNSRRMVRLLETGGRAARPLVATRGTDDVVRHGRRAAVEESYADEEDEAPIAPEPQPRRVSRFAANVRAEAKSREQETRRAEPRYAEPRQPELRQPEPRAVEARPVESRPVQPRPAEPRAPEPRVSEHRAPEPRAAEPRQTDYRAAEPYAEPVEDHAFAAIPEVAIPEIEPQRSSVFSGRGMPKMRQSEVVEETVTEEATGYTEAARPAPVKAARLVADRRPLR